MMNTPRCGNKDHNGQAEHARRRKRYALQGKLNCLEKKRVKKTLIL